MTHFVDLRVMITRPPTLVVSSGRKLKREILRQFQIEIPVEKVEDAEQVMDSLVGGLTGLFEHLSKEETDAGSIGSEANQTFGALDGR